MPSIIPVRRNVLRHGAASAAGGSLDPATTAWINAVVGAGGTVGGTQQTNVDTLIKALKSAGAFTVLDRWWLLGSENTQQQQIDIIALQSWTSHGAGSFSVNSGYTGDGSTGYLDSNFIPLSAGGNWTLNSATIGAYVLTNRTTTAAKASIGSTNASANSGFTYIVPLQTTFQYDLNGNTFPTVANGSARGHWMVTRTTSSLVTAYKNGSSFGSSGADSATVLPNQTVLISATNNIGLIDNFSDDECLAAYFGGGMDATMAAAVDSAVNTYATALGKNVH